MNSELQWFTGSAATTPDPQKTDYLINYRGEVGAGGRGGSCNRVYEKDMVGKGQADSSERDGKKWWC